MSEERAPAGKSLLSGALLVAAVGAILLAGLILRTSGRTEPVTQPRTAAPAAALPLGSEVAPEIDEPETPPSPPPAPSPRPVIRDIAKEPQLDPLLMKFATRAEADAGRLSKAKGRWTAQLMVACKPETVDRVLAAGAGAPKLYLIPARVNERRLLPRVLRGLRDSRRMPQERPTCRPRFAARTRSRLLRSRRCSVERDASLALVVASSCLALYARTRCTSKAAGRSRPIAGGSTGTP